MPFWRVFYHLVWGTKDRYPTIDEERAATLRTSIIAAAHEHKALVHAVGVMPDHVHVAVSIPPSVAVSRVVQGMKGRSSYHINLNRIGGQDEFAWQSDYGLFSFGERALPDVVAYIRNQRQHTPSKPSAHILNESIATKRHRPAPRSPVGTSPVSTGL